MIVRCNDILIVFFNKKKEREKRLGKKKKENLLCWNLMVDLSVLARNYTWKFNQILKPLLSVDTTQI